MVALGDEKHVKGGPSFWQYYRGKVKPHDWSKLSDVLKDISPLHFELNNCSLISIGNARVLFKKVQLQLLLHEY